MSKIAPPVILSDAERAELQRWCRAKLTPEQVVLRSRIVLLAGQGRQDLEIAAQLNVNRHTVRLWRNRFRADGLACVWKGIGGRKTVAKDNEESRVKKYGGKLESHPDLALGKASVNMADVAKAAGVHQTTVSRALRKDPSLPEDTRHRLIQLAEQMGYRRNPLVSALIAERKRGAKPGQGVVLALLSPGAQPNRWRSHSPTYTQLYRYMREQAEELGYHLEEFALEDPLIRPERLRRILLARGIRGVVVPPMPITVKAVEFDFSEFASVALRMHLAEPPIDRVGPDYFTAMASAVDKLIATGHRRIGFVTDPAIDERVRHLSLGAFLVARQLMPKRFLPPKIMENWQPPAFHDWVERNKPDAILTPIYKTWTWVKQQLQDGGWVLPRELSLASLDCHTDTFEAGFAHNLKLEASSAIKLLARKVECAEFGIPKEAVRIAISGEWRDGELFSPR